MTLVLPTDVELVEAAAATYVRGSQPFIADLDSAIRVFKTVRADGLITIAIEGTHDAMGWLLDFLGTKSDDEQGMNHQTLGFLHSGFYASAVAPLTRIALAVNGKPYAICGHSLGAVMALMIGSLLIQDGLPPVKIGAFAPPRGGGAQFVKVATSVPFCAYRFGNDPVPEIPVAIPEFPWQQVPLTAIGKPMTWPFGCHAIENYVAGVRACGTETTT